MVCEKCKKKDAMSYETFKSLVMTDEEIVANSKPCPQLARVARDLARVDPNTVEPMPMDVYDWQRSPFDDDDD